jgi:hypothetical protein
MLTAFRTGLREIAKFVDSPKENLIAVNDNGEVVFKKTGDETCISIDGMETEMVKDAHLFHNHPPFLKNGRMLTSAWLSDADIRSLFYYKNKSITSITKYNEKIIATTMCIKGTSQLLFGLSSTTPDVPLGFTEAYSNEAIVDVMNNHWTIFSKRYDLQYRQYVLKTLINGGER